MSTNPFDATVLHIAQTQQGGLDARVVFGEDLGRGYRLTAVRAQWDMRTPFGPGPIRLWISGQDTNLNPFFEQRMLMEPVSEEDLPAIAEYMRQDITEGRRP